MAQITTIEQLRAKLAEPNPLTKAKVRNALDDQARAFITASPFLLLATKNADGSLEISPKGDRPGFVAIEDDRTLLLPDRPGNNLAFGLTNILCDPEVGLIFLRPATGETLRVGGRATIHDDPALCERLAPAAPPPSWSFAWPSPGPISTAPARCCAPDCGNRAAGPKRCGFLSAASSPRQRAAPLISRQRSTSASPRAIGPGCSRAGTFGRPRFGRRRSGRRNVTWPNST